MTRTSLDNAQWVSLMLVVQQIPLAWKRDRVQRSRICAKHQAVNATVSLRSSLG